MMTIPVFAIYPVAREVRDREKIETAGVAYRPNLCSRERAANITGTATKHCLVIRLAPVTLDVSVDNSLNLIY